jgi:hypothetical protein
VKHACFVYVDTSAYLALLLGDEPGKSVAKVLAKKSPCSSTLLLVEAERNLVRMSREKILSLKNFNAAIERLKDDAERFALRDVTPDLCLTGTYPPVSIPRSSDLVHLRTAMWFTKEVRLDGFLTCDTGQRAAAVQMRLTAL